MRVRSLGWDMERRAAVVIGMLTASVVPVVSEFIVNPPATSEEFVIGLGVAGVIYVYSLLLAVLLGGPMYLFLSNRNLVRWWSASLFGFGVGSAVALLYGPNGTRVIEQFFVLAPTGTLAGFVFWLVWSRSAEQAPTVK